MYGHRKEPHGIRACLSTDDGETWDYEHEIIIRDDLIKRAIVYPTSVVFEDYTVFTVYWDEDAAGVTSTVGSHCRIP